MALRSLWGALCALLVVLACARCAAPPKEVSAAVAGERPNIILIIADDMTWTDSGAYGSPDVPTPNIDRLAREGMLFQRAFQSTAMCAVTRQQIYTGLDPMRSGAYPQHSWVREGTKSVFHHLKALGYRVGLTGKTHVGPTASFPYETVGVVEGEVVGGGGDSDLPKVDFDAAREFINRNRAEPFFLVVASHYPHGPWTDGNAEQFDESKIRVPAYLADTPGTRKMIKAYYGEITALDDEVGRVLALVDEAGIAKNTLIIFTSEQGSSTPFAKWTLYDAGVRTEMIARWPGHIAPGSTTRAMVSYEDVTPTFVDVAGGTPPEGLDGRSFLNVLTAGAPKHREYVYGIHTNFGIIGGEPYPIRSVRDERYKLIVNLMSEKAYKNVLNNTERGSYLVRDWQAAAKAGNHYAAERIASYDKRPPVELYDLQTDPDELNNRADDPSLAGVRARLEQELDRWMKAQGDTGIEAELQAFDFINPAIVKWINEHYPDAARKPDGTKITPKATP